MSENKIKHLELLQSIITRMNTNSFQIKTFAITIVSAFLAVFASTKNECFILIGIFPVLLFWFLDIYYLQQEKKFRSIYDIVSGLKKDIKIKDFEMPIKKFKGGKFNYWKVFLCSCTVSLFYLVIIVSLVVVFFILECYY